MLEVRENPAEPLTGSGGVKPEPGAGNLQEVAVLLLRNVETGEFLLEIARAPNRLVTVVADDHQRPPGRLALLVQDAQEAVDSGIEGPHGLGTIEIPLLVAIQRVELDHFQPL